MEVNVAAAGFVVGIVLGMTSAGGGALLTPALLALGIPASVAVGSDVLAAAAMKLVGSGAYALRGCVHFPTVARLASGSVPGAVLGIVVLNRLPADLLDVVLTRGIGAVLIVAGSVTLVGFVAGRNSKPRAKPPVGLTVGLGFVTGFIVSTTSIGSGSVVLCFLTLLFPLGASTAVGTDLTHALVLSTVASLGHLISGRVDVGLTALVLLGALPGVLIGARLATAFPERLLRLGLAALLLGIGLSLVLPGSKGSPAEAQATLALGEAP